jgi:AraC-like DNA-binding protein
MTMDALSDALMKMKLKTIVSGGLDAGGQWALACPAYAGLKLHVVLKGEGWLSVEGHRAKYHIKEGDCGLQTSGMPYVVTKDLSIKKRIKAEAIIGSAQEGISTLNGGGDFYSITAHFGLEGHLPKILFGQLPPMIHIGGNMEQAAVLRWSLELFSKEFHGNFEGRALILNHLAPVMLLQMLRVYLAANKKDKNWLAALSDPKLSKAIEAMHSDYQRSWSLEALARIAGMSRSGFALNFKKQVGLAPMDYLMNWRMQRAGELLRSTDQNIAAIANGVGYESESAFSIAFKRTIGCRPGSYRKAL